MTQRWRMLLAVAAGLWLSGRVFAEPSAWTEDEHADMEGLGTTDAVFEAKPYEQGAVDSTTTLEEPGTDAGFDAEPSRQGAGGLTTPLLEKARSYESQEQYEKAIAVYRRAVKFDRRQPHILSRIAFCYGMLQDYPNAISYYREALRIQPDLVEERFRLGEAYFKSGQIELAVAQYRKLMEVDQQKAAELKQLIEAKEGAIPAEPEPPLEPTPEESTESFGEAPHDLDEAP